MVNLERPASKKLQERRLLPPAPWTPVVSARDRQFNFVTAAHESVSCEHSAWNGVRDVGNKKEITNGLKL